MVLGIVGLGIAGLSYTITNLLPKLQKEKTKVAAAVNYKVFMASLNDYMIHGLRERWCFNVKKGNVTDLLLSDKCGNGQAMEDIVTYPGNLERILWTPNNIGSTPPSIEAAKLDNRILAINYLRYHTSPRLASRLLSYEDIAPAGMKLSFTLTSEILKDMSDEHPMFLMTRAVRECIDSVDIELSQVQDASNIQTGDERKIGISIKANVTPFKIKCLSTRTVTSMSYYTFYPRRLHTFSLMKYGELDGSLHNEFHGPVYVAGDFVLPPEDAQTSTSSVFYNTLTLGVFNGGSEMGGKFKAGKIVNANKSEYTFTDRGHPYLSKQDSYKGFRGFRGGIRLDATEDKGFYNLFNHENSTAANMDKLKECIEEAKYQTTPSLNENSILAYTNYAANGQNASLKLSFTERNRFKPGNTPAAIKETSEAKEDWYPRRYRNRKDSNDEKEGPQSELLLNVPPSPNGTVSYGEFYIHPKDESFDWERNNHFAATIGSGSSIDMFLNYDAFDLSSKKVDEFLENIKKADRSNFQQVIDSSHVLYQLDERRNFQQKAEDLRRKCDRKSSEDCIPFGYTDIKCDKIIEKIFCNYSDEVDDLKRASLALQNRLTEVKSYLDPSKPEDYPKLSISMSDFFNGKKLILNQKQIQFSFSESWKYFFPILKKRMSGIRFQFRAFNYSRRTMNLNLDLVENSGNSLEFSPQYFTPYDRTLASSGWRKAQDNKPFYPDPKPIEELDCPDGMGLADWDLDMSPSTAFAWNYANTPSGVVVDTADHENLNEVIFAPTMMEGHRASSSKSVVDECTVPSDRNYVYGFYVCKRLIIKDRSRPLYMIGTFIVKDLIQSKSNVPVYWHSVWDSKASDLVMNNLNASNPVCGSEKLGGKTFNDLMKDNQLKSRMVACSSLDLVNNGPNNFSWTTVDPDIGIAKPGDTMTSQKVNRIQKWIIKEESRVEVIR